MRKYLKAYVSVMLTSLALLCLSACGKRSTPEPAYTPPPFVTEKPMLLDEKE